MKQRLMIAAIAAMTLSLPSLGGGLMTNTNYHIAFDRMMARGATTEIDAAYSNPAGMAWGHEGWQLSFNWQYPHQDRDITSTFPLYPDADHTHKFHGAASAPFVPGLFASYRHDRWALSAMFGIVGSGGYVKYDEGVPMFVAPLMGLIYQQSAGKLTPATYDIDAKMKGKQYIFGGQLNFTWKFNEHLAAAAGLRANYYNGYYRGHVVATLKQPTMNLVNLQLDCDQKGWGVCPIVGLDYRVAGLTLAARYEFRTKLNIPNKTKTLDADILNPATMQPMDKAQVMALLGDKVAAYQDGAKTRYDMPSLLCVAAGYDFTPNVRATVEYHYFDDKAAKMSGDRQKALTHGTHEIVIGAEWDINRKFTVSAGGQRTDYGISPDYQSNTSFACDSYSIGLGGAWNATSHLRVNLGYFVTLYSDNTKQVADYYGTGQPGTEKFHRTNRVFGLGIDYKF